MSESVVSSLFYCVVAAVAFMSFVFVIARKIKRYDLVDAAWGMTFITVALVSFFLQPGELWKLDIQLLVVTLVLVWGLRLSWHIVRRVRATEREDPRYVELRKNWRGNLALNVYFRIYVLQAILATVISLTVIVVNFSADTTLSLLAYVGLVIWVVGYLFESVGDSQLRSFISDPSNKGRLMTRGLWRYTRHPNYFGELTQWWGIFIISLTVPYGWISIVGPLLISYLIIFVSGIPLNEKRFEGRQGWEKYKSQTSILLPLPPKS